MASTSTTRPSVPNFPTLRILPAVGIVVTSILVNGVEDQSSNTPREAAPAWRAQPPSRRSRAQEAAMRTTMVCGLMLSAAAFVYGQSVPQQLTPAQQQIAWAEAEIHADARRAQPYNDLAVAYVRRNRETGDQGYLDLPERA